MSFKDFLAESAKLDKIEKSKDWLKVQDKYNEDKFHYISAKSVNNDEYEVVQAVKGKITGEDVMTTKQVGEIIKSSVEGAAPKEFIKKWQWYI